MTCHVYFSLILTFILAVCKSVWGGFPSTLPATKLLYWSNIVHSSLELVANQPLSSFTPAWTSIMMNTMIQNEAEMSINTLIVQAYRTRTRTISENQIWVKKNYMGRADFLGAGGFENLSIKFFFALAVRQAKMNNNFQLF